MILFELVDQIDALLKIVFLPLKVFDVFDDFLEFLRFCLSRCFSFFGVGELTIRVEPVTRRQHEAEDGETDGEDVVQISRRATTRHSGRGCGSACSANRPPFPH